MIDRNDEYTITFLYEKLNILFILTDDQRADTIRAQYNKDILIPKLDKLGNRPFVLKTITEGHDSVWLYSRNLNIFCNLQLRSIIGSG